MKFKNIVATDYCNKVADGTHDSPKRQDKGKFLITSRHIKGRSIDFENAYLISEEDFNHINQRSKVDQWDILISMIGEYCGFSYVERNEIVDYAVKNVGIFKTGDKIKAEWLYYYLISPNGKNTLLTLRSGTSQPYIPLGALRALEIPVPEDETKMEQIVFTLSSLEDKIELNLQMNQTLEAMAQSIFKEWFVNFNFPGFDGELVEGLPKGWRMGKLNEIAKVEIGRTPPRAEEEWFSSDPKDIKWISIKDLGLSGVYIFNTSEYLTQEAVEKFRIPIIPENTVVLSFKLTIGRLAITTEAMLSNEAIAQIKSENYSSEYIYTYLKTYNWGTLGSTSSIATAINSKIIKEMEVLIPDMKIEKQFQEVVRPIFEKLKTNSQETETLTQIRDSLLPKLMTGKIEIK